MLKFQLQSSKIAIHFFFGLPHMVSETRGLSAMVRRQIAMRKTRVRSPVTAVCSTSHNQTQINWCQKKHVCVRLYRTAIRAGSKQNKSGPDLVAALSD